MIDLHLHLDGSLPLETVKKLFAINKLEVPQDDILKTQLSVPKSCESLKQYLDCFELPVSLLQTRECLMTATYDLIKALNEQELVYAEIRFAPTKHTLNGMSEEDAVKAALYGISIAYEDFAFPCKLILCGMRGEGLHKFFNLVDLAKKYLDSGVVAIDLAGYEAGFENKIYDEVYQYARKLGVPYTIHAGEGTSALSVKTAMLENIQSKRIGHGVSIIEDETLLKFAIENQIGFEMCPTSNLQTKAVLNVADHPILKMLRMGAKITLNTDNMTVSDTTIKNEIALLKSTGLKMEEVKQLFLNSADIAFVSDNERQQLKTKIEQEWQNFVLPIYQNEN